MRYSTVYICLVILFSGCKAFKPSANMPLFAKYFTTDERAAKIEPGQVKVTFFGTSTLLFDDGETQLLVDGFFSRPPIGKVAFGKIKSDTALIRSLINKHQINRLKAVFVCHSHYDHAMDAPAVCRLTSARLYGSSSTLNVGKGQALTTNAMELYQPGKAISVGKFVVTIINSKHTPPFKLLGKTNATDPNHPDITEPLKQPNKADNYIEGGTYDIYIQHGNHALLVKASTNFIADALNNYPADVLFLGSAMLGLQPAEFQNQYFAQTVLATQAKTVVPIHWDNFTRPINKPLVALPNISDNVDSGLHFLIRKTEENKVNLKLMQAENAMLLF
ncbi:MAG: MBL fold metallo-hydrolase [Chitinophagales bacterium]|nr:MBL fold metallo-hydrolase [Chitinophagales bacterium]